MSRNSILILFIVLSMEGHHKRITRCVMTLDQKTLLASSRAIGMTENRERANVMMPIVMPPVRSVTQQQHRFRHGMASLFRHTVTI